MTRKKEAVEDRMEWANGGEEKKTPEQYVVY